MMKRIRLRTIFIFTFAILSGALLLNTSQNVQQAEEELADIQNSIQKEQDSIRVLSAEWEYLNTPARLEQLSKDYLGLVPPAPELTITEPSLLPEETSAGIEGDGLMHNISQQAETLPVPAKKQPQKQKDFSSLLNGLKKAEPQGGGQ